MRLNVCTNVSCTMHLTVLCCLIHVIQLQKILKSLIDIFSHFSVYTDCGQENIVILDLQLTINILSLRIVVYKMCHNNPLVIQCTADVGTRPSYFVAVH